MRVKFEHCEVFVPEFWTCDISMVIWYAKITTVVCNGIYFVICCLIPDINVVWILVAHHDNEIVISPYFPIHLNYYLRWSICSSGTFGNGAKTSIGY